MGGRGGLVSLRSRRAFLAWAGKGAMIVGLGGFMRFLGRNDHFVRPPGALPEEQFLSICLRCDECLKACPWGLITLVPLNESIISAGTPQISRGYCPRCWKCIPACPTGALQYWVS